MPVQIKHLPAETHDWLDLRARSRGTSVEVEASALLNDAVHNRIGRERLFQAALDARIPIRGAPLTEAEIEAAINWGRD